METTTPHEDVHVVYVQAASFPAGILAAHDQLRELLHPIENRSFYGVSYPDKHGNIIYRAAATEAYDGEAEKLGCGKFTIRKGMFRVREVPGWRDNEAQIKDVFDELIATSEIDKEGYCLEEYASEEDMRCMVPLEKTLKRNGQQKKLLHEVENTFNELQHHLSLFNNETLNKVPFQNSWTAGQVIDHIIQSTAKVPDDNTKESERFYDEKILPVRKLFLDFNIKMESPEFIIPRQSEYDKSQLLKEIQQIQSYLLQATANTDLTALCLDFELPSFGYLTRYEWINFFLFHTQRHTHQIKKIYEQLNKPVYNQTD